MASSRPLSRILPWAWLGPQGALASACPSKSCLPGEEEGTRRLCGGRRLEGLRLGS